MFGIFKKSPGSGAAASGASSTGASTAGTGGDLFDPIQEAEVYFAYGRPEQAARLLAQSLWTAPERKAEAQSALLEIDPAFPVQVAAKLVDIARKLPFSRIEHDKVVQGLDAVCSLRSEPEIFLDFLRKHSEYSELADLVKKIEASHVAPKLAEPGAQAPNASSLASLAAFDIAAGALRALAGQFPENKPLAGALAQLAEAKALEELAIARQGAAARK